MRIYLSEKIRPLRGLLLDSWASALCFFNAGSEGHTSEGGGMFIGERGVFPDFHPSSTFSRGEGILTLMGSVLASVYDGNLWARLI